VFVWYLPFALLIFLRPRLTYSEKIICFFKFLFKRKTIILQDWNCTFFFSRNTSVENRTKADTGKQVENTKARNNNAEGTRQINSVTFEEGVPELRV